MLKKLQEFGDHDVERPVQRLAIEQLRRILTDLLQGAKGSLKEAKVKNRQIKSRKVTQRC